MMSRLFAFTAVVMRGSGVEVRGRFHSRSAIAWAYDVQDFQIEGNLGPDRFDVVAKAPAPAAGA